MKTAKKKENGDPRTMRDALAAQVLGDIDTLLDKLDTTNAAVNGSADKIQETILRLEEAGESYNQAVLAANMRSKQEMVAYLKTVTATVVSTTGDEQREIIRALLREAISDEIAALKRSIANSSKGNGASLASQWLVTIIVCMLTALLASAGTVAFIRLVG
jgi:ABC-type transporter Mla subunit MlaD